MNFFKSKTDCEKSKILFIGHGASKSGAPLVLLNFAKWIKDNNPNIVIDILLLNKGECFSDYIAIFNKVYVLQIPINTTAQLSKIIMGIESVLHLYEQRVFKRIIKTNYDIIYSNTVVGISWGCRLKKSIRNSRLIVHVHELNGVIKILEPRFAELHYIVDKFVCVSQSVLNNLIENYGISASKINLVYAFIDINRNLLVKEKVVVNYFKVGAAGFADWRKGYDLFLLTAYFFRKKYLNINIMFQWVGGGPADDAIIIDEDIKKLGLKDIVVFSGKTTEPLDEFNQFDLFLLLSREDPFPLVCLEAGSLGKPIVCFEKAGGIPELIADGGGVIVPYLDIEEIVNTIYHYYKDRVKLQKDGDFLKRKIQHYDLKALAPKLFEIILNEIKIASQNKST